MTPSRPGAPARSPVERYGFLDQPDGRVLRGERIVRALADLGGVDVASARILDVGCSAGLMSEAIARSASLVVAVDVDVAGLALGRRRGSAVRFAAASGDALPFDAETFDAVVCNHVYEHVRDAGSLMDEIHRVLRSGGVCYFAAGHRLQLIEPHHRVPLLSWVPPAVANAVMRTLRRGASYDERFVYPWQLRRLLRPFAAAEFISGRMLRVPHRYGFEAFARWPPAVRRVVLFGGVAARLAPTWIYLLRKS